MKKTNFTFRIFEKCTTIVLSLAIMLFSPSIVNACEMSCGGKQQVSLDENCEAEITAEMILSDGGASCDGATFTVAAKLTMTGPSFIDGATIILDGTYIGQELVVEITSDDGGIINKCWGFIELEDKLAPTIECEDITVACSDPASQLPTFLNMDCDPDPTINLIDQTEVDICDSDIYFKEITRIYTATDQYNNTSLPCTQVITIERIVFDDIEFPENFRNDDALLCNEEYPVIEEGPYAGHPHPDYTGVPYYDGVALYPTENFNCNIVVSFSDFVLPEVQCRTKIMRTWTVSEWVCGEDMLFDSIQIIEIVDTEGPEIVELNDVSISTTTGYDCEALYLLPQVVAEDECKDLGRTSFTYPGGFIDDYDGSEIINLEVGVNDITVTVYDACGNSSIEVYSVIVEDNTAPVAVCDQNTVVALSSLADGITEVPAITFDDGSYDECAMDGFLVKRMDDGDACGFEWDEFDTYVTFCCADIGSNPIVIFRVFDAAGNHNDCMVNVELQDKLPPTIICPTDMTVDCDLNYSDSEQGLIDAFGDATFADNCAGSLIKVAIDNTNQCSTGDLVRVFTASDANGSASCAQTITFVNDDLFDGYDEDQLEWPENYELTDCLDLQMGMATEELPELSPDITGRPIISEDACDMVGADYDDRVFEIFNAETASCFKIIRTWTVRDWCQMDEEPWEWDQVIMVRNTIAPTFTTACDPITVCTFDGDCNDGEVTLMMAATDDCTPSESLAWQFSIDKYNDGSFDSISPILTGASVDATGDYPIGTHRIVWTVEDRCGNKVSCTQMFTVENCKTPTPYCYNGLAIDLMTVEGGGMIDIWASDFDAGSFHQCGYDVTVSFSSDPTDTSRDFDCSHVGIQNVEIWASAELPDGTIVQDFCTTYVDVQDNMDACSGTVNLIYIAGNVATEMDESIEEVMVSLDQTAMEPEMTDETGEYAFAGMQNGGSYIVSPSKSKGHMNGVSTMDLVLIQRHILGLAILDSPYKIIAADINNDKSITASDLLNLRKNILGIDEAFNNNDAWRFVDKGYDFIDSTNPLSEQFLEIYNIGNLQSDMVIDFVGVKVGDVDASVIANARMNVKPRSGNALNFEVASSEFEAGNIVKINVTASNFDEILAYQHSISLSDKVSFLKVIPGVLDLNDSNFGLQKSDEGIITTSWNVYNPISFSDNETLYTIVVRANNDGNIADVIEFNSAITPSEAFGEIGLMDVSLTERDNPLATPVFKLYQNSPNPFNGITNVKFELPTSGYATFKVFDVTGKLLYSNNNNYESGINTITLDVADFGAKGVLYYTLQTEEHTATKKMVVLE